MLWSHYICLNLILVFNLVESDCKFPDNLNIPFVNLSSCGLNELKPTVFGIAPHLPMLFTIDLSKNELETIGNRSFTSAVELRNLDLSENHLKFLEEASFEGLVLLENIKLDSNSLTTFNWIIVKPCAKLRQLEISDNILKNFISREQTTLNLQELDVAGNDLTDITEMVERLTYLNTLWLGGNRRLLLGTSAFSKNPSLKWLDLKAVGLKNNSSFSFLDQTLKLEALYMDDNDLAGFKLNDLPLLGKLENLTLSKCHLNSLDYDVLVQKFPNLKTINVRGNKFNCSHLQSLEMFLETNSIKIQKDLQQTTLDCIATEVPRPDTYLAWLLGSLTCIVLLILSMIGAFWLARSKYGNIPGSRLRTAGDILPEPDVYVSLPFDNFGNDLYDELENQRSSHEYTEMTGY